MTIVEQAIGQTVGGTSEFIATLRALVRAWLDEHADDVVFRVFGLFAVRVHDIRHVVEHLLA